MNYDKELADKILAELSKSTQSTLVNLQKNHIPQLHKLEVLEVLDGEYKHLEKTYTTKNKLFRVLDMYNIKRDSFREPYIGTLGDLINTKDINPFLLFIDDEVIDPREIQVIADDRYMYLELTNYTSYNFQLGMDNVYTEMDGVEKFNIPKISPDFSDGLHMEIILDNPIGIEKVVVNGNELTLAASSDMIFANIPYEDLASDDVESHAIEVEITFNQVNVRTITFTSLSNVRRNVNKNLRTMIMNMDVEFSEDNYTDDTIFIMHHGMIYTADEYDLLPIYADVSFINKLKDTVYYLEGTADAMEDPFPEFVDYRFWKENFITFRGNYLLYPNDVYTLFTDMGDLDSFINKNYIFKLFYNTKTNLSVDNAYKLAPDQLDKYITRKKYADMIFEIFDYKYDIAFTLQENMEKMFKDIISYNSELMNDYFNNFTKIRNRSFSGTDVMTSSVVNEDGFYEFTISKYIDGTLNNSALIYHNGLLMSEANIIENANGYTVLFDFDEIEIVDTIDVVYYLNTFNKKILFKINSKNEARPYNTFINKEDIEIYCETPLYQSFNLPNNPNRQYKVDYEIHDALDGQISYEIHDDLYELSMYMVSKRQFRRMQFVPVDPDMNCHYIYLNSDFKFCQNEKHFIAFVNGRRLDSTTINYIPHGEDLPITDHYLILDYKLDVGDVVDVVYLPEPSDETYIATLPDNGIISFGSKDIFGYPFTDQSFQVFVNGKKISQLEMKILSAIGFAVTVDTESMHNVTLVRNIDYNDSIFDIYKTCTDIWIEYNKFLPKESLKLLHGIPEDFTITNIEPNMNADLFTKEMVYFEVLRKHWIQILDVLDPTRYYNYSLNHPIAKFKEIATICKNYFEIEGFDGATFEAGSNRVAFDILPAEETVYVRKTSDDGVVLTEYRQFYTMLDRAMSASTYIWLDTPLETLDTKGIHVIGRSTDGSIEEYLGTLEDRDGNSLLFDLTQKRWTRVAINEFDISEDIDYIVFAVELRNNTSEVNFCYGKFDRRKVTDSGTQLIPIDPAKESIDVMPNQDNL